jgi:hypothetical protein
MAEPVHEQISRAIVARLREINEDGGHTFWYTPDAVKRCLDFETVSLDDSYEHLLFVKPTQDAMSHGASGSSTIANFDAEAGFEVLIVRRDPHPDRLPDDEDDDDAGNTEAATLGPTVIARCVHDVRTVLLRESTLDGLVWNVLRGETLADYSYNVAGWLAAVISFSVEYDGSVRRQ